MIILLKLVQFGSGGRQAMVTDDNFSYAKLVSIRFWFSILQIMGLLPFSVVYLREETRFSRSLLLEIYQLVLTGFISFLSGYLVYYNVEELVKE